MSAVLTALDYCDEAKKGQPERGQPARQIKDYLEESAKARMEAGKRAGKSRNMKQEIQTLRMRWPNRMPRRDRRRPSRCKRPISPAVRWHRPISRPAASAGHPVPPQALDVQQACACGRQGGRGSLSFLEQDGPKGINGNGNDRDFSPGGQPGKPGPGGTPGGGRRLPGRQTVQRPGNAGNFDREALKEAVEYCHIRGVKIYLAINTLMRDEELPGALALAEYAASAPVDALIGRMWGLLPGARRGAGGCAPRLYR